MPDPSERDPAAGDLQPARKLLAAGLDELSLAVTTQQIDSLLELSATLHAWSKRLNLTGHKTLERIVARLVLDAAALASVLPELESLVDLGSGAGFPGLPLAVLRPRCRITLVESRERRHYFQLAAVRALKLPAVTPLRGRVEDADARLHAGAIAQAIAEPSQALAWMQRWVEPGGLLALPLSEGQEVVPPHAISHERSAPYCVPGGGPNRILWLGRVR